MAKRIASLGKPLLTLAKLLAERKMKLTELYLKDTEGRLRLYNIYTCDSCGSFYKKQQRLASGKQQEHYCSKVCYNRSIKELYNTKVECAHCGIEFWKANSKLDGSKSGLYFCCREHKDLGQKYIKEIQPEHYGTGTTNYREQALSVLPHKCNRCGYDTNVAALQVHHKDRNRLNSSIENLEILCANCHAIEHWG